MGVALYAEGKFGEAREWPSRWPRGSERHRAMAQSYLDAIDARTASAR